METVIPLYEDEKWCFWMELNQFLSSINELQKHLLWYS
jgi:hypothetical protein